jgi:hypothetical protein
MSEQQVLPKMKAILEGYLDNPKSATSWGTSNGTPWVAIELTTVRQILASLAQSEAERERLQEESEKEPGRWQDAIYKLLVEETNDSIDGGGCDSGDPLDFTISEISQAIGILKEELARERELHQWVEIKDGCRLPEIHDRESSAWKISDEVLVIARGCQHVALLAESRSDGHLEWSYLEDKVPGVTHWKPLDWPALLEDKAKPVATTS